MIEDLFLYFSINPWTVLHWMIAISITLFVFDIFLQTEVISGLSVLIFAAYFTIYLSISYHLPLQWTLVLSIVVFSLVITVYCILWIKLLRPFLYAFFMRAAIPERAERAVNQIVLFRVIDDKEFVEFEGALCDALAADDDVVINDCDKVRIIAVHDGNFLVELVSRKRNK